MGAKYKTIAELVEAVRRGDVKEENLQVTMDNDCSYVVDASLPRCFDADGRVEDYEKLFRGDGYCDTEPLWKALFPKAEVEWC